MSAAQIWASLTAAPRSRVTGALRNLDGSSVIRACWAETHHAPSLRNEDCVCKSMNWDSMLADLCGLARAVAICLTRGMEWWEGKGEQNVLRHQCLSYPAPPRLGGHYQSRLNDRRSVINISVNIMDVWMEIWVLIHPNHLW